MDPAHQLATMTSDERLAAGGLSRGPGAAPARRPLPTAEEAAAALELLVARAANQRPRPVAVDDEVQQLLTVAGRTTAWLDAEVTRRREAKLTELAALAAGAAAADAAVAKAKTTARETCAAGCLQREGRHSLPCHVAQRELDIALADAQGPRSARADYTRLATPHALHAAETAARCTYWEAHRLMVEARQAAHGTAPDSPPARVAALRHEQERAAAQAHAAALAAREQAEREALTRLAERIAAPPPAPAKATNRGQFKKKEK